VDPFVDGEHHGRHGHVDVLAPAGALTLGEAGQDGLAEALLLRNLAVA
jgi:hypothetical protein